MAERQRYEEGARTMSGAEMQRRPAIPRVFAAIAVGLVSLVGAASAVASTPIAEMSITPSSTQAGGHPDIHTLVWVLNSSAQTLPPGDCFCHDAKNVIIDAPAGAIPNVYATPRCTAADFGENVCPIDSQVGVVQVGVSNDTPGHYIFPAKLAMYNMVPRPNQAGLVGFHVPILNDAQIFTDVESRTEGDYGLEFKVSNINHFIGGVAVIDQTFWGVPADHSHDANRFGPQGCDPEGNYGPQCEGGYTSNAPLAPFITAPTVCGNELEVGVTTESYDLEVATAGGLYSATTGCDQLSFNPSLFAQPTAKRTDTASGLDIDLKVPPAESPAAPSPSEIKATSVTLPEGFSINPNAADGKEACSPVEARVGFRHEAAQCPESSKVGSLTIESSALPGPLPGFVYLADPKPGDPYRLWLIADGFGQHVKLPPGSVKADPVTGRLTASFENLPQFPFNDFNMHFFGSERGLLATPKRCGTYPVESTFVPWDGALPEQTSTQYFNLDEGPDGGPCPSGPRPFAPSFKAGVSNKGAGVHAPLTIDIARPDGDQNLAGLTVKAPPGFAATLKGIPYCPQSVIDKLSAPGYSGLTEQAASACPAASQVGTAVAGAGAGTHPVYVSGKVYLAGPYKGAPLSLETVVPALSGPYDLGVVAVRTAISVDPRTAQVSAGTDPLPQILEGIPLRTRFIRVSLDRNNFALNPTNCDPFEFGATLSGDEGASAPGSTPFQVANCAALDFGPKLSLALRGSSKRLGHPALHAELTTSPGEANISRTVVAMPSVLQLDQAHVNNVCTNPQFKEEKCPANSVIGKAKATTPLLDAPLEGKVYLRSNPGGALPLVVADLKGQFEIELVGEVDSFHGGLRTTFASVPDAPVTSFTLDLKGKSKGLLRNTVDLCKRARKATVQLGGQNGAVVNRKTTLSTGCGGNRHKRYRRHAHRAKKVG